MVILAQGQPLSELCMTFLHRFLYQGVIGASRKIGTQYTAFSHKSRSISPWFQPGWKSCHCILQPWTRPSQAGWPCPSDESSPPRVSPWGEPLSLPSAGASGGTAAYGADHGSTSSSGGRSTAASTAHYTGRGQWRPKASFKIKWSSYLYIFLKRNVTNGTKLFYFSMHHYIRSRGKWQNQWCFSISCQLVFLHFLNSDLVYVKFTLQDSCQSQHALLGAISAAAQMYYYFTY